MIFISKKRKIKIGKLLAAEQYIATQSMTEKDTRTLIENMSKIIENLVSIALEIGGNKFAEDVERYYAILKRKVESEVSE